DYSQTDVEAVATGNSIAFSTGFAQNNSYSKAFTEAIDNGIGFASSFAQDGSVANSTGIGVQQGIGRGGAVAINGGTATSVATGYNTGESTTMVFADGDEQSASVVAGEGELEYRAASSNGFVHNSIQEVIDMTRSGEF